MRNALAALPALAIATSLLAPPALAEGTIPHQFPAVSPGFSGLRGLIPTATPGQQCRAAIHAAEQGSGIPRQLLAAIGRIESGRPDSSGRIDPWPWSINVEGTDHVYDSKAAAISAVQAFQAQGIRSIDVGCLQVNLMFHPDAFASLDQAFDPGANAAFGARFLTQLYGKTGSWIAATADYHSATPELGGAYQRKVAAVWPEELRRANLDPNLALADAGTAPAPPSGGGAYMLGNHAQSVRILPLAPGAATRGLEAYRSIPIPIAGRPPARAPL